MATDISRFIYVALTGQIGSLPDVAVGASPPKALSSTPIPCKVVIVTALHGNSTSLIRCADIGKVGAGQGTELGPGESVALAVNDVADVGIYGANATDKVSVTYLW